MARKQQNVVSTSAPDVQSLVFAQLADVKKRFVSLEKQLVKRGRAQQRELEVLLKGLRSGAPLRQLGRSATATSLEVKKQLTQLQGQVLGALGVASHSEIAKLNREFVKLSKKVDALAPRRPPAEARGRG